MTAATNGESITSQLVVADGVDTYSSALPGIDLDAVRTGTGFGPSTVRSVTFSDVALASGSIGFPVMGQTSVADDRVAAVLITVAPPGSRWCEIDLEPGTILLYGPGSEHTGVSPVGLEFAFATVELNGLEEAADRQELPHPHILEGHVRPLAPRANVRFLAAVLRTIQGQPFSDAVASAARCNTVEALAAVLSTESSFGKANGQRRIDNHRIVRDSVQYSEAVGRNPSLTELSRATFVSERWLRDAFTSAVGIPPRRYFHHRTLNEARRRLVVEDAEQTTVSRVATDLGFSHLGRFASEYARVFDEPPSATLSA